MHFSLAASFVVLPRSAAQDLLTLASAYSQGAPHPSRSDVARACAWTKKALALETNLKDWYGQELNGARQAIRKFNKAAASRQQTGSTLRPIAGGHLVPSLSMLLAAIDGASGAAYGPRLIAAVCDEALRSSPNWPRLDRDVRRLAAHSLAEGRDGPTHARWLAGRVVRATSNAQATAAITDVLSAPPEPFEVAVTIEGASRLQALLPTGVRQWGPGVNFLRGDANTARELEKYVRSARTARRTVIVLVEVPAAFDPEQARRGALERAELIHDGMHAEHRATSFSVRDDVLVLGAGGVVAPRSNTGAGVQEGRFLAPAVLRQLSQALRLLAIARNEAAPAMAITEVFTALEHLAQGAVRPAGTSIHKADFLPAHVGGSAELVAAHQYLAGSHALLYEAARLCGRRRAMEQLSAWLGSTGDPYLIDLDRWALLLDNVPTNFHDLAPPPGSVPSTLTPQSSVLEAAIWLRSMAIALPVLVQVRLTLVARLWHRPTTYLEAVASEARWAAAHTDRLRVRRNEIVHSAVLRSPGDDELAVNGLHLLDAVFTTIPRYLATHPWRAMRDALLWRRRLWRSWSTGTRPSAPRILGSVQDLYGP